MILILLIPLLLGAGFLIRKLVRRTLLLVAVILRTLVALAGAALVAAVVGTAAFLLLPIIFLEDWFGALVPSLAILAFILSLKRFMRRRERRQPGLAAPLANIIPAATPFLEDAQRQEADTTIAAAWNLAATLAPAHGWRLRAARNTCARVHAMAAGDAVEWSIIDCSTFISRTVPDAVTTAAALIKEAEPSERAELAEELVANLERLATRARREVDGRRLLLRNRWNVIKTHIANRTAPAAS